MRASATLLALLAFALPAASHHGFSGRYDFSRPWLIEGQVVALRQDRVHVEFSLLSDAVDIEAAHGAFSTSLAQIEGRVFRPVPVAPGRRIDFEVDPVLSRRMVAGDVGPEAGALVRIVAYCRISDDARRGWLRVMAIQVEGRPPLFSARRSYHVVPGPDDQAAASASCPR